MSSARIWVSALAFACRPLHPIPVCLPDPQPMGILHIERRGRFLAMTSGDQRSSAYQSPELRSRAHLGRARKLGNMTESRSASGRLFVLDLSGGRIFSLNPDGSDPKTLVTGCRLPDGLAVASSARYVYCTNMALPQQNGSSIVLTSLV